MQNFVELWVYLSATPLFGLTATLVTYVLARAVYQRAGHAPWANPVLWTVLLLALLLTLSGTPYPTYFSGAQFIHFLLGPAVVALRWERVRTPVAAAAQILLDHLSLLFVPVGVGVMTHLGLVSQYGVRLLLALVVSTWIGLAVTALVLRAMLPRSAN